MEEEEEVDTHQGDTEKVERLEHGLQGFALRFGLGPRHGTRGDGVLAERETDLRRSAMWTLDLSSSDRRQPHPVVPVA